MRRVDLLITAASVCACLALGSAGCASVCGEDLLNCTGRCDAYKACKERGCQATQELSYVHDCRRLGVAWSDGVSGTQDDVKAAEYYKVACDGGDGLGCAYLGLAYEDGRGVRENKQKALVLYRKGCTESVTIACLGVERLQTE